MLATFTYFATFANTTHHLSKYYGRGDLKMTTKETLYLDDALGNAKFMAAQCCEAANTLQDPALKRQAQRMADMHSQIYTQFYNLI